MAHRELQKNSHTSGKGGSHTSARGTGVSPYAAKLKAQSEVAKIKKKNVTITPQEDLNLDSTEEDSLYASPLKKSPWDPSKCPCDISTGDYMIDCSSCHQFWHVKCVSLDGLVTKEINKLIHWKCPFCYISPVCTTDAVGDNSCLSCRNTRTLRDANSSFEAAVAAEKLKSISNFSDQISKIDFDSLKSGLTAVQDLDLHVQHLLLSKDGLAEHQNHVKQIENNMDKIYEAVESKLGQTTRSECIDSLTVKIQHLDDQYSERSELLNNDIAKLQESVNLLSRNKPPTASSAPASEASAPLLESISEQLERLCANEPKVVAGIDHLKQALEQLQHEPQPSHPPPPAHPSAPGHQLSHKEKPVAISSDNYIDTQLETELLTYLDSCADQFKSEGGRSCLSFGEQYKYTGSRTASSPAEVPPILRTLMDKINAEFCSNGEPEMNSCLINRFDGPNCSLPQHSDNEASIHPESCIFTLSLGSACTVSFAARTGHETHEQTCQSRSLYSMTRRSQEHYTHCINNGSISNGRRYSITMRSVSFKNRNATCIIGDSNTGGLKFGSDAKKSFGSWLPGRQVYAPTISHIDPSEACGYKNVVILCGINDLKKEEVKNLADINSLFSLYVNKIECIQAVNPKAHVYVCPPLPTKRAELNKKAIYFNHLICTKLLPSNFGVTFVDGFDGFLDSAGLLNQQLARNLDKYQRPDYLHLNWRGVAKLGVLIRDTVLSRMNGGYDRRRRRSPSRTDGRSYRDVVTGGGGSAAGPGHGHHDGYQPW